jgi:hypothetical protein
MKKVTLLGRGVLAAVIAGVLVIPAAAIAGPGGSDDHRAVSSRPQNPAPPTALAKSQRVTPASKPSTAGQGQPAAALAKRIANVLAARKRRFDAASKAISAHITRVSALADKVEVAGGDVSKARDYLGKATDAVASANALEQETAAEFRAISGASNRRSAFKSARTSGARAVAQLKIARANVVLALRELRSVTNAMKTAAETSESP